MFLQRAPNPPEFAQPRLRSSNGGHPQQEGTNLGVFVPIWLVLSGCEATNLGVFHLCDFALLKQGCANSGGLELADFFPDTNGGRMSCQSLLHADVPKEFQNHSRASKGRQQNGSLLRFAPRVLPQPATPKGRFVSGRNCTLTMTLPNPSPVLAFERS